MDAATSMTAWLQDRARMTRGDAARSVASAKRLRAVPLTSAAATDGALSGGQVKVILANVTERSASLFATRAESSLDGPKDRPEPKAKLHLSQTLGDRWRLDADLDALSGEILDTALRLAERPLDDAESEGTETTSASQRRADALDSICRFFLEHRDHPSASRHRPHVNVNVIVDIDDLEAGRGGSLPMASPSTGPPWPPWCATRRCTAWSCPGAR
ncbi:MAG: hypothetical protein ACR2G7_11900 [Acidimicrobiales bacterium]